MINPKFVDYIEKLWNNRARLDVGNSYLILDRLWNVYKERKVGKRYWFVLWLREACTYEDLAKEFNSHEVVEISMYQQEENYE